MARKLNAARISPLEPLLLSFGIALFSGIVTFIATRDIIMSLILFGVAFIIASVVFATLLLMMPNDDGPEKPREIFIPVLMREDPPAAAPESTEAESTDQPISDAADGAGESDADHGRS